MTTSMFARKSIAQVRAEAETTGLQRRLGPVHLVLLGIGCIVGAGVYVMTGMAAANYAGPAVVLSFIIAAVACGLTGLCYAELSSVLPVSGASYTYAYAALGEVFAWALGWMLILEFGLAGAALAVGFSGYLGSLLGDFGLHLPAALTTSTLQTVGAAGHERFVPTLSLNLVALLSLAAAAAILIRGIAHSAAVNALLVTIKVGVLIGFVAVGSQHIHAANWTPFLPKNEGGFHYGLPGVFRAASILFFAYLGFEAVATAASEARMPQRDIPIGILGALLVSTLLYIAVSLVMTGLAPFRSLNVADPIAVAIHSIGLPVFSVLIKIGALTGLASVLLVNTYAHSRVCYAMSCDGLLPQLFSRLHLRFATPARGTLFVALTAGLAAAFLPIGLLADLISIGTAFVFLVVAMSVIWLRSTHPDLPRPFRVPCGGFRVGRLWLGVTPVLAALSCFVMMGPVLLDLGLRFTHGDLAPGSILIGYIAAGGGLYATYGRRKSRVEAIEDADRCRSAQAARPSPSPLG
ncbi:MAG: amino acid permease [Caulobacteraceae bacterium]